jgi:general stress protein YciG
MKSYKNEKDFNNDAVKMQRGGWQLQATGDKDRKTAIGRTAGKAVLTGGIGLLLGGRSKKGNSVTATWVR